MRLTPSWLRSSSDGSGTDESDDPDSDEPVTIYHSSSIGISSDGAESPHATEFIPDSNDELLETIEEMETPVTVDELADRLIHPAHPPVETWAAIHEQLHQDRLPELDTADEIAFDEGQGLVDPVTTETNSSAGLGPFRAGSVATYLLLATLVLLSVTLLSAVTVAFVLGPMVAA